MPNEADRVGSQRIGYDFNIGRKVEIDLRSLR